MEGSRRVNRRVFVNQRMDRPKTLRPTSQDTSRISYVSTKAGTLAVGCTPASRGRRRESAVPHGARESGDGRDASCWASAFGAFWALERESAYQYSSVRCIFLRKRSRSHSIRRYVCAAWRPLIDNHARRARHDLAIRASTNQARRRSTSASRLCSISSRSA